MTKVRTSKNICLNCFGTLDNSRVCLSCKKKADDTQSPPHHLPQRVMLADKYLICKALGEGGFGITYLAWDVTRGIKVAIKEYFPSGYVNRMPRSNQVIINSKQNQAASNRGLKRFIDEAKMLAKIKNLPGIVSVRDFFSANGTAYIVMEFLDGISLKKYLQRKGGKVSCDEILGILRPVMDSLISVHRLGLIHRDISPDNILITKNNEVKLIDFGAAKQSNLDGKSLSIVLKQGFAPEEQYRTHGEQGPWTDIYALGVTIYYSITGTLPPESIQRLYKDTIIRPSEKGAVISPTQESALMKSLAVYAKHRYQDVTQMMNGLYGIRRTRAGVTRATDAPILSTPMRTDELRTPRTSSRLSQTSDRPVSRLSQTSDRPVSRLSQTSDNPATGTSQAANDRVISRTLRPISERPAQAAEPKSDSPITRTRPLPRTAQPQPAAPAQRVAPPQESQPENVASAQAEDLTDTQITAEQPGTETGELHTTERTSERKGAARKPNLFEKLFGKKKH